jgi:hypothetical protein
MHLTIFGPRQQNYSLLRVPMGFISVRCKAIDIFKGTPWSLVRKRTIPTERPTLLGEI